MNTGWGLGNIHPKSRGSNDPGDYAWQLPKVVTNLLPPAAATTALGVSGWCNLPGSVVGGISTAGVPTNGIYNPFIALNGFAAPMLIHQPYIYDQWAAYYARYAVYASKMTATFYPQAGAGTEAWQTCLGSYILHAAEVIPTNRLVLLEADRVVSRVVSPQVDSGSNPTTTITMHWNILGEQLGLEYYGEVATTAGLNALISANPTVIPYFTIFQFPMNNTGAATTGSMTACTVRLDLEYQVIFYNGGIPGASEI